MKKNICILSLIVFSLFSFGCGNTGLDGLVPGSGTITLNGKPIEGVFIVFSPLNAKSVQRSASAKSGPNGKFDLLTLQPGDGVYPGEYKIVAKKTQTSGSADFYISQEDKSNPELKDDRTTIHLLPRKYSDPAMTDMLVTIPPKGNKSIELKLEGEVDLTPVSRNRNPRR